MASPSTRGPGKATGAENAILRRVRTIAFPTPAFVRRLENYLNQQQLIRDLRARAKGVRV
jgi:hypothetical protein